MEGSKYDDIFQEREHRPTEHQEQQQFDCYYLQTVHTS